MQLVFFNRCLKYFRIPIPSKDVWKIHQLNQNFILLLTKKNSTFNPWRLQNLIWGSTLSAYYRKSKSACRSLQGLNNFFYVILFNLTWVHKQHSLFAVRSFCSLYKRCTIKNSLHLALNSALTSPLIMYKSQSSRYRELVT